MFVRTSTINKILKMKSRIKIVQGGSSGGKTVAILSILSDRAIKQDKIIIDVISMTYNHLETGAIQDFKNIMDLTGRWNEKNWNETKHIYKFSNGSQLRFKAIDKEQKAKGPRRDILYVCEANYIPFNIFNQLFIRTNSDIYLCFNPVQEFWAHDLLKDDDSEMIVVNYKDNESLNDTIINSLLSYKKKWEETGNEYWLNRWKVYGLGEIGRLEGAVFNNWSVGDLPEEAELIAYGIDFGFSNDATAVVGVYRFEDKIWLDEILYQTGLFNKNIDSILQEKGISRSHIIWGDSSSPQSIAELQSFGWSIIGATKGHDSINQGILLMQSHQLMITPNSTNLKEELLRYMWKVDASGKSLNKPIDGWNHILDAARYVFLEELQYSSDSKIYRW